MTVICAIKDNKTKAIWIACDKQTTYGDVSHETETKWIVEGHWAIGISGLVRGDNIVRKYWKKITEESEDIFDIVNKLGQAFKDHGFKVDDNGFPTYNQSFIITDSRKIWNVCGKLSYREVKETMAVAGSGWQVALGAYHTINKLRPGMARGKLLQNVIETVNELEIYCGQGVWQKSLPMQPEVKVSAASEEKPAETAVFASSTISTAPLAHETVQ